MCLRTSSRRHCSRLAPHLDPYKVLFPQSLEDPVHPQTRSYIGHPLVSACPTLQPSFFLGNKTPISSWGHCLSGRNHISQASLQPAFWPRNSSVPGFPGRHSESGPAFFLPSVPLPSLPLSPSSVLLSGNEVTFTEDGSHKLGQRGRNIKGA